MNATTEAAPQSAAAPSPFPPIADYAFLSDCHTGALVAPDVSRRSLAIEPMTCAPNASRTREGLIRLEPGQSFTSSWGIDPRGHSRR